MYKQSLTICQAAENSDLAAHDLEGLGHVLQAQGRLEEARQVESKSIAMFDTGGQTQIIDADVSLASILLDLGAKEDAAVAAGKAIDRVDRSRLPDRYRSDAEAVLARVLLAQGKIPDSRKMLDSATAVLGRRTSKETELDLSIIAARVRSASADRLEKLEAAKSLRLIAAEAHETGFVPEEFEARLALAESELNCGDLSAGRTHLTALDKAAKAKGFELISQRARAMLHAQQTSNGVWKSSQRA